MINITLLFFSFFFIACAIKFIFNYNIGVSMFIGVTITTIIVTVSGLLEALDVGLYIGYTCSIVSVIFCIYYVFKMRYKIKDILLQVFTPGMIILILAYFIYYIVVRDKVLVYRDEATAWVLEIKYMYTLGIYKSFTSHNNIIAFFTYYMTNITGYSEPIVFLSRWFFVWVCLILPIADLTWKNWKRQSYTQ